ncbi:MAG: carboxylesterase family protein [Firmicutes bacterium]|nr:carboxylesterase family protein [Bacillota bacterium]
MLKVKTIYGEVSGEKEKGYSCFRGIPYASPPIGELRFAPPKAPQAWEGVRDGKRYGSPSLQMFTDNHVTQPSILKSSSEDCLYLNVSTSASVIPFGDEGNETINMNEKLPVYVFVHGGAFETGGGNMPLYDGKNFAGRGIVYISINYRLSVFGSLALKTLEDEAGITGSYAVLDMLKALEWVKDNIAFFGGDPDKVTVGGESAGAFAVSVLMGMPAAKGLFRNCILESGSIISSAASSRYGAGSVEKRIEECRRFCAELGVTDTLEGISLLRSLPAEDIIFRWFYKKDGSFRGLKSDPLLKNVLFDEDRMPDPETDGLNEVNLLFGFNTDEGTMFIDPDISEERYRDFLKNNYVKYADEIWERYPVDRDHSPYDRMSDVLGLQMFKSCMLPYADALSRKGMNVYAYHFDYLTERLKTEGLGCRHIAELNFVFNRFLNIVGADNEKGRAVAGFMNDAWVNFIKTNSPGANWLPFDPKGENTMRIGNTIRNSPLDRSEELRFFEKIMKDSEIFKN